MKKDGDILEFAYHLDFSVMSPHEMRDKLSEVAKRFNASGIGRAQVIEVGGEGPAWEFVTGGWLECEKAKLELDALFSLYNRCWYLSQRGGRTIWLIPEDAGA
jgi:hypothetical protein